MRINFFQVSILFCIVTLLHSCALVPVRRATSIPAVRSSFPPNPVQKPGWVLVFHDEFNDSILDREKWDTKFHWDEGTNHNGRYMHVNPKEYYLDDFHDLTDSTIRLKCDTVNLKFDDLEFNYGCGLLDCSKSFEQRLGYFEIRSRNPASPGFWPAFWLISKYSWPPEIDIYEFYTSRPRRFTNTIHFKTDTGRGMEGRAYRVPNPSSDFHIYAVEWNENEVKWYFDNALVRTTSTKVSTFTYSMHIIVNNAMEDPRSKKTKMNKAEFPGFLEVDYVRAYRKATY